MPRDQLLLFWAKELGNLGVAITWAIAATFPPATANPFRGSRVFWTLFWILR